jgi:hypothetical protein
VQAAAANTSGRMAINCFMVIVGGRESGPQCSQTAEKPKAVETPDRRGTCGPARKSAKKGHRPGRVNGRFTESPDLRDMTRAGGMSMRRDYRALERAADEAAPMAVLRPDSCGIIAGLLLLTSP